MFDGADEREEVYRPARLIVAPGLGLLIWLSLGVLSWAAFAQTAQFSDCSQTVGASPAAVSFPSAGNHGNVRPFSYLEICNAHGSNTLGVNASGGSASIGAAGTLTLNPGGCAWWPAAAGAPVPAALSVVGSAGSTTTACWYN